MKSLKLIALIVFLATAAPVESQLTNISTRGLVLTGDDVQIVGFIVTGTDPKPVLIRARGPILADFGVPGELSDPVLQLFSGQTMIADNDDWETTTSLCQNSGLNCRGPTEITATGLDPCVGNLTSCFLESVIYVTLNPGPYTAIVSGFAGATGVGLVEVFGVGTSTSRLTNISTRGVVGTGDDVMIGGLIIAGTDPKTVLIRARGPVLADFGVPGELADPFLQLFSGQTVIAQNDNWQTTDPLCGSPAVSCGGQAEIVATGLDPCVGNMTGCAQESAILITLPPGPYTAIVSGMGGGTGVGLVEVFEVGVPQISGMFPTEGPSGTLVVIGGTGFTETSRVTFGQTEANQVIFVSESELGVFVPLGTAGQPLPAGTLPVRVDGSPADDFIVTSLPDNPNPPGAVLQNVTASLTQQFSTNTSTIEAAISELQSLTTDSNGQAYLQMVQDLLPELEQFLTDMPSLLAEQVPTNLSVLERLLLNRFPPEVTSQMETIPSPAREQAATVSTDGDKFLEDRKSLIDDAKDLRDLGLLLGLIPAGEAVKCAVQGVLSGLTSVSSAAIDIAVGNVGRIVGFEISDETPPPASLEPGLDHIVVESGQSKQLFAFIHVERVVSRVSPVTLKTARSALTPCVQAGAISFLPLPLRKVTELAIDFLNTAKSLGFAEGGFDSSIGERSGPVPVNFSKLSFSGKPFSGTVAFTTCTFVSSGGVVTACDVESKRGDLWEFKIQGRWVDQHLDRRRFEVIFDIVPVILGTLTVTKTGTGSGGVTSSPPGLNCPPDTCSEISNTFESGTTVTLTATAEPDSTFDGWSRDCTGTSTSITVIMNDDKTCIATFTLKTFTLTVSKTGTGSGTVTSSPAGINCGADCSESYSSGAVVTLTATPAAGSTFAGLSGGGCSDTGCTVTMNASKTVTATFNEEGLSQEGLSLAITSASCTPIPFDPLFGFLKVEISGTASGPAETSVFSGFFELRPGECSSWTTGAGCTRGPTESSSTAWTIARGGFSGTSTWFFSIVDPGPPESVLDKTTNVTCP